jgi:amino acid transporter
MKTDEGLIRAVGVRGLTAAIINYTIGAGIFVLPAVVAGKVGNAAPLIYVICAIAMALIVMCFAEAGSRVPLSGGTYAYAGTAFGPYVGFMVAMLLWLGSNVLASAAVANVSVDTLGQIFPVFLTPFTSRLSTFAASRREVAQSRASRQQSSCRFFSLSRLDFSRRNRRILCGQVFLRQATSHARRWC